jgi:hypothetical protein
MTGPDDDRRTQAQRWATVHPLHSADRGDAPPDDDDSGPGEEKAPEWGPLRDTSRYAPPLPVDALPWELAQVVEAVAYATQVPTDLVIVFALGLIAGATWGRWKARIDDDRTEIVALCTMGIADSGERKSQVLTLLSDVIAKFETRVSTEATEERDKAVAEHKSLTDRVERLRKAIIAAEDKVDKTTGREKDAAQGELVVARMAHSKVSDDLRRHQVPHLPIFLSDDMTPEAAVKHMSEQDGHLCLLSDEARLFSAMQGRYTGIPDTAWFLNGQSGTRVKKNRVAYDTEMIVDHPSLSAVIAIQPGAFAPYVAKTDFAEVGVFARILATRPKSMRGHRLVGTPPIPTEIKKLWNTRLRHIMKTAMRLRADAMEAAATAPARASVLAAEDDEEDDGTTFADDTPGRRTLPLTEDARRVLLAYERKLEPRYRDDGDLLRWGGVGGKSPAMAVRIASVFALFCDAEAKEIDEALMARGVRTAEAFIPHAMVIYGSATSGGDLNSQAVEAFKSFIVERGEPVVRHTVIVERFRKSFGKLSSGDCWTIMEELEAQAVVLPVVMDAAQGKNPGGAKVKGWKVRPELIGLPMPPGEGEGE